MSNTLIVLAILVIAVLIAIGITVFRKGTAQEEVVKLQPPFYNSQPNVEVWRSPDKTRRIIVVDANNRQWKTEQRANPETDWIEGAPLMGEEDVQRYIETHQAV